jgi:hypothetical protein
VSYAFQNIRTSKIVFSTPKPLNPQVSDGLRWVYIRGEGKDVNGVELDWKRARPSWEYSNEYDEAKKFNAYKCN